MHLKTGDARQPKARPTMNANVSRRLGAATLTVAVLAAAWVPPAEALPCTAPSTTRSARICLPCQRPVRSWRCQSDGDRPRRIATFTRTLEAADIEVIVVRVPFLSDTRSAEARQLLAQKRALALRNHLAQLGVAEKRIYTAAAGRPINAGPVMIETIAL